MMQYDAASHAVERCIGRESKASKPYSLKYVECTVVSEFNQSHSHKRSKIALQCLKKPPLEINFELQYVTACSWLD